MKKCGVYVRIRSNDPTYEHYMCKMRKIAKENRLEICQVYRDDGEFNNRDRLEEMARDIVKGYFSEILTKNFTSFGNDGAQMFNTVYVLKKLGVTKIHTYFESFDLSIKLLYISQMILEDFIHFVEGTSSDAKGYVHGPFDFYFMCKKYETELENFSKA